MSPNNAIFLNGVLISKLLKIPFVSCSSTDTDFFTHTISSFLYCLATLFVIITSFEAILSVCFVQLKHQVCMVL